MRWTTESATGNDRTRTRPWLWAARSLVVVLAAMGLTAALGGTAVWDRPAFTVEPRALLNDALDKAGLGGLVRAGR